MFYVLSRFAGWVTNPVAWVLMLLVGGLFISRRGLKRWMLGGALCGALIFSIPWIEFECAAAWVPEQTMRLDSSRHWAYVFLPGGMTNFDLRTGRVEYGEAGDRIIEAASLYHLGLVDTIVISGDGGPNYGEDRFYEHLETVFSVPRSNVLVEREAVNTFQNFTLTQEMVGAKCLNGNVLVVNSGQYMRRTMYCALLIGWKADYYSVDYLSEHPAGWTVWVPTPSTYESWSRLIHEIVGYWAYSLAHGKVSI